MTGADLVPTVADLAGVADKLSKDVEGGSLKGLLGDPATGRVDRGGDEVVFHFPHYDKDQLGPVSAIIVDNFKLLRVYESERALLFDLSKDIGEQNDIAAEQSERVQQLDTRLTAYLTSIGAGLPTKREAGDTNQRREEDSRRGGGQGGGRGGQGGGLFRLLDVDRDGRLSAKEIDGALAVLTKLDANKDGMLDAQELNARRGGGPNSPDLDREPSGSRKDAKAQRKNREREK